MPHEHGSPEPPAGGLAAAATNLISLAVLIEPNFPALAKKHRENYGISLVAISVPNGPGRPGFGKAGPGLSKFSRI